MEQLSAVLSSNPRQRWNKRVELQSSDVKWWAGVKFLVSRGA